MAQISTRKRGSTWEYSFEIASVDGKRKRKSKGGFRTKKECLDAGVQAKAEYDNGGSIKENSSMSYTDFLKVWYDTEVKPVMKLSTQSSYLTAVNKATDSLGHYKLSSITPRTLNNYFNSLLNDGYSTNYVRFIKRVINASLNYAVDMEYLKNNPCERIKIKTTEVDKYRQPTTITKEQFELILDSLDKQCKYFRIPFYIGWYTGLRIGETLALTWDDINFEGRYIDVNKTEAQVFNDNFVTTPKTPTSVRKVLIGDNLINILKEWKQLQIERANALKTIPPDRVCTRTRTLAPIRNSNVKQQCKKLSKQLDIPFHFHVLRHTHATLLIKNGVNIKEVQARLGHKSIQTTLDIYTHIHAHDTINSVNVFENL